MLVVPGMIMRKGLDFIILERMSSPVRLNRLQESALLEHINRLMVAERKTHFLFALMDVKVSDILAD
jgi:hypothetical protein